MRAEENMKKINKKDYCPECHAKLIKGKCPNGCCIGGKCPL